MLTDAHIAPNRSNRSKVVLLRYVASFTGGAVFWSLTSLVLPEQPFLMFFRDLLLLSALAVLSLDLLHQGKKFIEVALVFAAAARQGETMGSVLSQLALSQYPDDVIKVLDPKNIQDLMAHYAWGWFVTALFYLVALIATTTLILTQGASTIIMIAGICSGFVYFFWGLLSLLLSLRLKEIDLLIPQVIGTYQGKGFLTVAMHLSMWVPFLYVLSSILYSLAQT